MKTPMALLATSPLKTIFDKVEHLCKLNQFWICFGRTEWTTHCQVANYDEKVLTLTVPNSSWATRIHYAAPEIVKDLLLCHAFADIRKVRCRIVPEITTTLVTYKRTLSKDAGALVAATADRLNDGHLKDSLTRLASRFISSSD